MEEGTTRRWRGCEGEDGDLTLLRIVMPDQGRHEGYGAPSRDGGPVASPWAFNFSLGCFCPSPFSVLANLSVRCSYPTTYARGEHPLTAKDMDALQLSASHYTSSARRPRLEYSTLRCLRLGHLECNEKMRSWRHTAARLFLDPTYRYVQYIRVKATRLLSPFDGAIN